MKKIFVMFLMLVGFAPVAQADTDGALIGGIVGGLVGSRFGQGNGNSVAIAAGAIAGTMIGDSMTRPSNYGYRPAVYRTQSVYREQPAYREQPRSYGGSNDPEVRREYERGLADRALADHQEDLRRAYQYGRGDGGRGW